MTPARLFTYLSHIALSLSRATGYLGDMANHEFPKVLRGYDIEVVETRLTELDEEVASLREQLTEATEANTALRLNILKQVEQAGAEAAVVLNHARSEATRIRELAEGDAATIAEEASRSRRELVAEASQAKDLAFSELEAQRSEEAEIMVRAKARAENAKPRLKRLWKNPSDVPMKQKMNYASKNWKLIEWKWTSVSKRTPTRCAYTEKLTNMRGRRKAER